MAQGWTEKKKPLLIKGKVVDKSPKHRDVAIKDQLKSTRRTPLPAPEPQFHPFLMQAYGITEAEINETIESAEQPSEVRNMFNFLSFYARLSDPKYKVSNEELDSQVRSLRNRMLEVSYFYEQQAKDSGDIEAEEKLLKVVQKAKQVAKLGGDTRLDKVLYVEAVISFEHTTGSVIPVAFGIEDYGREDYWVKKLLNFLRNKK